MPVLTPGLPAQASLLLDLDGTLLDLAATPAGVVVPAGLVPLLRRLRARLGDALAIVTGRPIEQVYALLDDGPYAVAGEHGAVIRHHPGAPVKRVALPEVPARWLAEAARVEAAHPGVLLERKAHGFVLHYRQAPQAGPALHAAMLAMHAQAPGRFAVMQAHMAWEMKPLGADKGTAVTAIMERAPFAGRTPVYIGDDVTDEDAMRAARALGGIGWRVQEVFGDAAGVRAWLADLD